MSQFVSKIQGDSDICNNCFRRRFESHEKNFVVDTHNGEVYAKEIRKSVKEVLNDDRDGHDVVTVPAETMTRGTQTACECGAYHYWQTIRPIPKDDAIDMAGRLAERLEEKGVEFDEDVLYDVVREQFSKPENQGKQDDTFAEAVNTAIA